MAAKPDSTQPDSAPAAGQTEALSLDDACQRLSESAVAPEALAGFYAQAGGEPPADLAAWHKRFETWLKQPA